MTGMMADHRAGFFDLGNSFDVPWTDDGKDYLKQLGIFEEDLETIGSTHPGQYYQDVPLENNPEAYLDFLCRESMRKKKDTPRTWKTLSKKRNPVRKGKDFEDVLSTEEGSQSQRSSSSSGKNIRVKVQGRQQERQAITKPKPNENDIQIGIQDKEQPRKSDKKQGKPSKALQLFPQRKQKSKNDKTKTDITSGIIKDCKEIEKSYSSEDVLEKHSEQGRKFKLTGWKKPWVKNNSFETQERDMSSSKVISPKSERRDLQQSVTKDIEVFNEVYGEKGLGSNTSNSISPLPDVLAQSSDLEDGFSPELSSTRNRTSADIHWRDNDDVFLPSSPSLTPKDDSRRKVLGPESQSSSLSEKSSIKSPSLSESQTFQTNYIPQTRLNQHGVKTLETVSTRKSETVPSSGVNECITDTLNDPQKCALYAASIGDLDLLKRSTSKLSKMECLRIRDEEGNNLLHRACNQGHIQCVEFLYKLNNSLLNNQNKTRLSPVACAIKNGQIECLDWMLENTSLLHEIREPALQRNAVHHAARYGQDGCLRLLIERFQNEMNVIEHTDPQGDTPAHLAAKYGQLTCLQTLVEYGIDVTKENKFGQTPCSVADLGNNRQCAGYLTLVQAYKEMALEMIRTELEHNRHLEEISTLRKCLQESLSTSATLIKMNQDILGSYNEVQTSLEDQIKTAKELCHTAEAIASENVSMKLKNRSNMPKFHHQDLHGAHIRNLQEKLTAMEEHFQRHSVEKDKLDQDVFNEHLTKVEDITRKLFTLTESTGDHCKDQYDIERRSEMLMRKRLQEASKKLTMNRSLSTNSQPFSPNLLQIKQVNNEHKQIEKTQPIQLLPKYEKNAAPEPVKQAQTYERLSISEPVFVNSPSKHETMPTKSQLPNTSEPVYANTRFEEEKTMSRTRYDNDDTIKEMALNLNELSLNLKEMPMNEGDNAVLKTVACDTTEDKKSQPETPLLSPVASSSGEDGKPSLCTSFTAASFHRSDKSDPDYVDLKKTENKESRNSNFVITDKKPFDVKSKNKLPTFLTKEEILFNDDLQETVIGNSDFEGVSDFEDNTKLEKQEEKKLNDAKFEVKSEISKQQVSSLPSLNLGKYKDTPDMLQENSQENKQTCEETPKKPPIKEKEVPSPVLQQLLATNVPLGLSQLEELTKSKRQTMAIPNKIPLRDQDFKETYARQQGGVDKDMSLDSDTFDGDSDSNDPLAAQGIQLFGERHYTCEEDLMSYGDLTDSSDDYDEDEHDDFYPRGFSRFGQRLPTIEEVSVMSDSTRVDTDNDSVMEGMDNDMGSTETLTGEPSAENQDTDAQVKPIASENTEMPDSLTCPLDGSTEFPKLEDQHKTEDNSFRSETDKAWYDMSDDDEVTQWHLKKEKEQKEHSITDTTMEHYTVC